MNTENESEGLSLLDLIHIVRKNLVLIISIVVITTILGALTAMFVIKPKYQSTADVMIQVEANSMATGYDYTTAQKLVATIVEFLQKDIVLEEAGRYPYVYGLDTDEIKDGLTITSSSSSYFINISYTSTDPMITGKVVNAVIDAGISIANNNDAFSSIKDKISRTSTAKEGVYSSPNKLLYTIGGAFIGLVIAGGVILLKELMNNTYQSREQLEAAYGITVIGVIPKYNIKDGNKYE